VGSDDYKMSNTSAIGQPQRGDQVEVEFVGVMVGFLRNVLQRKLRGRNLAEGFEDRAGVLNRSKRVVTVTHCGGSDSRNVEHVVFDYLGPTIISRIINGPSCPPDANHEYEVSSDSTTNPASKLFFTD